MTRHFWVYDYPKVNGHDGGFPVGIYGHVFMTKMSLQVGGYRMWHDLTTELLLDAIMQEGIAGRLFINVYNNFYFKNYLDYLDLVL